MTGGTIADGTYVWTGFDIYEGTLPPGTSVGILGSETITIAGTTLKSIETMQNGSPNAPSILTYTRL